MSESCVARGCEFPTVSAAEEEEESLFGIEFNAIDAFLYVTFAVVAPLPYRAPAAGPLFSELESAGNILDLEQDKGLGVTLFR